jgi:uncharacterized protein YbaR (Trm112 family)
MFIPLVDSLRCPNAHPETWLVASIDRAEERDIKEGMLGCPQCLAEYPVREGIVHFGPDIAREPFQPPDENEAVRVAAALELTDPRMTAVLHGAWGAHAMLIRSMTPVSLLLINPPEGVESGDGISIVLANSAPLAVASMDGAAVGAVASTALVATLCASLRGGRRMLGPLAVTRPAFLLELARDAEIWVAQLDPGAITSAPVLPTRRLRTESR